VGLERDLGDFTLIVGLGITAEHPLYRSAQARSIKPDFGAFGIEP